MKKLEKESVERELDSTLEFIQESCAKLRESLKKGKRLGLGAGLQNTWKAYYLIGQLEIEWHNREESLK